MVKVKTSDYYRNQSKFHFTKMFSLPLKIWKGGMVMSAPTPNPPFKRICSVLACLDHSVHTQFYYCTAISNMTD